MRLDTKRGTNFLLARKIELTALQCGIRIKAARPFFAYLSVSGFLQLRRDTVFNNYLDFCDHVALEAMLVRAFITKHKLGGQVLIDHICYRCHSKDWYDYVSKMLAHEDVSNFAHQVWLSGRRVNYFGFVKPIEVGHGHIRYAEVQDAKPLDVEESRFHHIEIYPASAADAFGELVAFLKAAGENLVFKPRPHHDTYDVTLEGKLIVRISQGPLVKKIGRELARLS